MESNFQMLRSFEFHPKQFGVCTAEEVQKIEEHFKIKERSDIELQNLRDFVVVYFSMKTREARRSDNAVIPGSYDYMMDTVSAITAVIDEHKWRRGMEV